MSGNSRAQLLVAIVIIMKPKYIAKSGQPWTAQETSALKQMGGKVPTRVISLKLQRPVGGVQAKAQEIGMSLKPINRPPRSKLK